MLAKVEAPPLDYAQAFSAHVVVVGNEKGGSGKSTTAMHVALALLKAGQRVATLDLDARQSSFTRHLENRRAWAQRIKLALELPTHFRIAGAGARSDESEFASFAQAITTVEHTHDFIVIDTPGADSYMTRLAHSMADTLVTPLNDSFVDFDVLATIDPQTFAVTGTSHYSEMVREARRQRRLVDGNAIDWVVVRNRLSVLGSRNRELIAQGAHELAGRLGFRFVDGLAERIIYREFFPRGLSALDDLSEQTLGIAPGGAHGKARQEVEALVAALKLPIDERGRRRAAARAEWRASADTPLALHDVLAG